MSLTPSDSSGSLNSTKLIFPTNPPHLFLRVLRPEYASAHGHTVDTGLGEHREVGFGYSSDGDKGHTYALLPHDADELTVAFNAQQGRKMLLGGCETQRPTAYIVGSGGPQATYVGYGVGRSTYDTVWTQPPSGLVYGHVVTTQVYTVGPGGFYKVYAVVENESGPIGIAKHPGLESRTHEGVVIGLFHAQLHPSAAAFERHAHTIQFGVARGVVGNELYFHILIVVMFAA